MSTLARMSSVSARRVAAGVVGLACVIGAVLIVWGRSEDGPSDSSVALRSSVRVTAFGCSRVGRIGVGAAVGDGLVATVAHVVAGSTEITVMTPDGEEVPAAVVAIDRERDLAVLDVDLALPVLELGTPVARSGGSYVVWREDAAVVVDAELTRLVSLTAPTIDHDETAVRKGIQIAAEVVSGDSGSIVVSGGRAVAMVFARSTQSADRGWATDVAELSPLLASLDGVAKPAPVDVGACT
ncbi:MAG: hypothetical protein RJB65_114 [Actinomycetota bacterium]